MSTSTIRYAVFTDAEEFEGETREYVERITCETLADAFDYFEESLNDNYPEVELGGTNYGYGTTFRSVDEVAFEQSAHDVIVEIDLLDFPLEIVYCDYCGENITNNEFEYGVFELCEDCYADETNEEN